MAADLRLFDCFAWMGMSIRPPLAPAVTPEDLLAAMDRCGIYEALVSSDAAQVASVLVSNRQIAAACERHPRLHPVWAVLPNQAGEMDPGSLFAEMKARGVGGLRADPGQGRFLLNGITLGPLLDAMVERRVPFFLNSDWRLITDLLKEFESLTVVATSLGCWGPDRYFRPLLERFENFHVEISSYELDGGVKALVDKYGPGRILFGSAYHGRAMGGASMMLRAADIDDEAKAAIAHGNLERLIGGMKL